MPLTSRKFNHPVCPVVVWLLTYLRGCRTIDITTLSTIHMSTVCGAVKSAKEFNCARQAFSADNHEHRCYHGIFTIASALRVLTLLALPPWIFCGSSTPNLAFRLPSLRSCYRVRGYCDGCRSVLTEYFLNS